MKPKHYYQEGIRQAPNLPRLPRRDTMIWRYMSLSKFLDLISRRSLFLGQLAVLQKLDPFEGSLGASRLAYLQRIMQDDAFARQELHIPADQPISADLRRSFDPETTAWQNQRAAERAYISCWHINPVESANLWTVYAAQGEGVAIQTSVGSLVDSLDANAEQLTIAPVRYIDHHTYEMGPSPEDAAFYKRTSFKAERELRIRYLLPWDACLEKVGENTYWHPPAGIYMNVDCNRLIEQVHISPMLGDWFKDTVQALLSRLGLAKKVVKSSINDPRIL